MPLEMKALPGKPYIAYSITLMQPQLLFPKRISLCLCTLKRITAVSVFGPQLHCSCNKDATVCGCVSLLLRGRIRMFEGSFTYISDRQDGT